MITKGMKVKVKLPKGNWHVGEYLGSDKVFSDSHKIGVLETSIKGVTLKPGKKYISIFTCKLSQIEKA